VAKNWTKHPSLVGASVIAQKLAGTRIDKKASSSQKRNTTAKIVALPSSQSSSVSIAQSLAI
jgi:hypothetical protein